jgi:hypothetical protein
MAAELAFQAIVDLVGDKLREVFNTGDIGIQWYDEQTNLLHCPYDYSTVFGSACRVTPPESLLVRGETRQPLVINNAAEARAGTTSIPGTDTSLSSVRVPILGSDRVLGRSF